MSKELIQSLELKIIGATWIQIMKKTLLYYLEIRRTKKWLKEIRWVKLGILISEQWCKVWILILSEWVNDIDWNHCKVKRKDEATNKAIFIIKLIKLFP